MSHIETPEQRFGRRDNPYHYTGEVPESDYFDRLNPIEKSYLIRVLRHFKVVAQSMNTSVYVFSVGSSADLQWPEYRDIDILVCLDEGSGRSEFSRTVTRQLSSDPSMLVHRKSGPSPVLSNEVQPHIKIFPILPGGMTKELKQFDLTFVGATEGSFGDVLAFHQRNNLAFCRLTV